MKDLNGHGKEQTYPIGTVRIRTRHKRNSEQRAYIKAAEPNVWVLRARWVWEQANGPIPRGMGIHHKDEDKLNDAIGNLELRSKSQHLDDHRPAFVHKCIAALARARKQRQWSTKSAIKRTGRHPRDCNCPLHARLDVVPHVAESLPDVGCD